MEPLRVREPRLHQGPLPLAHGEVKVREALAELCARHIANVLSVGEIIMLLLLCSLAHSKASLHVSVYDCIMALFTYEMFLLDNEKGIL